MFDIDMDAVAAAVDEAVQGEPWKPEIGEKVLYWDRYWDLDDPFEYGGPSDSRCGDQLVFGRKREVRCEPQRVAPADTPLADPKDKRLDVVKSRRPFSYLPGDWRLTLAMPEGGATTSWFKTKRDATAAGRIRLAILDFHAACRAAAAGGTAS